MWHSRCAITNRRFGGHVILTLARWNPAIPPYPHNLVLVMQTEAQKLEATGIAELPREVVQRVEERLKWAETVCADAWSSTSSSGNVTIGASKMRLIHSSYGNACIHFSASSVQNLSMACVGFTLGVTYWLGRLAERTKS